MLLDNQFNYVSGNNQSGAIPVGSPNVLNTLATTIKLKHSGYLYIWVSNETQNWMVFFDNLSVQDFAGPLLEETHYYPFGLTMSGISDKALKTNYAENKYRYNGKELQHQEFSDGTGLEEYDYGARMQDPQLGRFWQQDKFADKYIDLSPYQYAAGNPIKYIDKNGDSLTVVGKQDAVQGFKDITNQGLGGFYNVQQNESGTYSLVSTGKDGEMTDQQQAFYDAMNGVMTGAKDVSLIAVMNDPKVDFGSFQSGTIDVGDMMKFNSINDPNATGSTREGLLAHEVVEQGELANSGVNKSDLQAMKDAFGPMHKDAIQVENQVNGSTRMSDMERTRIGDKTYTKYFLGKNGITVEKTTNFTNNMQVDKRSLQIGVLKPQ